jgi:phospholipid transport system substrate-binding protein
MLNQIFNYKAMFMLLALLAFSMPSYAEEMTEPELLVKTATDDMLLALKEHKVELEEDPNTIYPLVQTILMPHFDFEKMSMLALGKNWSKATTEQKERFVEQFQLLLVRTYSTALLEYTDNEILMQPFKGDISKRRVSVPMAVTQATGPSIPMALSLYLNKEKAWKVYDVKIDGISLVTNYRSSFASQIRKEGMDKLIEDLAERNEKVKV